MTAKVRPITRHVISINDLKRKEIEDIFEVASDYLQKLGDRSIPHRIGRGAHEADDYILASLFYEPSTRTRLSFESAMLRLGGTFITSADPAISSVAKGESLADTVRVMSNYADVIVLRHPRDGAARLAADYSPIPVINGGDGAHEHPTQTLCDLFTLTRKNKTLKNLKVAIAGDLKGSRTIHSFVYALARFGAQIIPLPAKGLGLPAHVDKRLREEFGCEFQPGEDGSVDALYQTPSDSHQPTLFSAPDGELNIKIQNAQGDNASHSNKIDAVYVTRFQKERSKQKESGYTHINADFLKQPKYSRADVLHPLPRVNELDVSLDSDSRAAYFEQAAYGVPIRMALISLLLGLRKGKTLHRFEGGFEKNDRSTYDEHSDVGIACANGNCIVHDEIERPYARNRFYVIADDKQHESRLRCVYCENDIDQFVIAHKKNKWYSADPYSVMRGPYDSLKDFLFFESEDDAKKKDFHARKHPVSSAAPHKRAG